MIDPTTITHQDLLREHPERAVWRDRWSDYRLAYEGGDRFLAAAGESPYVSRNDTNATSAITFGQQPGFRRLQRRFLWQNEGEPDVNYYNRWDRAAYLNYAGSVVNYFDHFLFSQPPQIRPAEGQEQPDWVSPFLRNANGSGRSFVDFVKDVFLDVLVCKHAGWMIGQATSVGRVEEGDDSVELTPFSAEEILDWQKSPCDELEWVVVRKQKLRRDFPAQRRRVDTVTYLDAEMWATWEIEQGENGKTLSANLIATDQHNLGVVPFVWFAVPAGLWVMDKIFMPAMAIFNADNALKWMRHVSCFPQPFLRTRETDSGKGQRIWGESYVMELRAAKDGAEEAGWLTADVGPIKELADQLRQDRDELYRTLHMMSLAVDSQATTAIARSGASKIEDRRATEILLVGYGQFVAKAMRDTMTLLSRVIGDETTWTVDGFQNFDVSSLDEELQTAALADALGIKSPTFKKRLQIKLAGRMLDQEDETTLAQIAKEIQEAIDEEQNAPAMPVMVHPTAPAPPSMESMRGAPPADEAA